MEPCAHEPGCGGGLLWFHIEPDVDYEEQVRAALNAAVIAALVILGAFFGEGFALTHVIPAGSEVLAGRVLGTLDSALLAVLYYYFGGSAGSDRKTELLANGQPAKEGS